jgi:hypothetical protein
VTIAQSAHLAALQLLTGGLVDDFPEHGGEVTTIDGIDYPLDACHVCDGRGMNCPECGGSGNAPMPTYPEEV